MKIEFLGLMMQSALQEMLKSRGLDNDEMIRRNRRYIERACVANVKADMKGNRLLQREIISKIMCCTSKMSDDLSDGKSDSFQ